MMARQPARHGAAALKYDLLTMLGVIGLGGSSTLQRSMIRLMTLVTARYNWRSGEMTVGRREIARLWGVDERTVKREMARLRETGLLVLRRAGVRGRVSAYGVDFDAVRAACDFSRVGPDFVARMTQAQDDGAANPARTDATVIPFRQPGQATPDAAQPGDAQPGDAIAGARGDWSAARLLLRSIGPVAHARWIAPLQRAGVRDGRLTLSAPSAFHAAYVERTYLDAIRQAVHAVAPAIRSVRIEAG